MDKTILQGRSIIAGNCVDGGGEEQLTAFNPVECGYPAPAERFTEDCRDETGCTNRKTRNRGCDSGSLKKFSTNQRSFLRLESLENPDIDLPLIIQSLWWSILLCSI